MTAHETFALKGDRRARERLKIKSKGRLARRSVRYKLGTAYRQELEKATGAEARDRRVARTARRLAIPQRQVEIIDRSAERPGPGAD